MQPLSPVVNLGEESYNTNSPSASLLTVVLNYLHICVCHAATIQLSLSFSSPSPPLLLLLPSLLSLPHPHKGVLGMPFLSAVMPTLWPKYVMTSSMNSRCRNNLQLRIPSGWSSSTTRGSSAGELRASEGLSGGHEETAHPD